MTGSRVEGMPYRSAISLRTISDTHWMVRKLYEHYGPHRLCWASDYPPVISSMTYQQSLEVFRTHCNFIPEKDQNLILGLNMQRLLEA